MAVQRTGFGALAVISLLGLARCDGATRMTDVPDALQDVQDAARRADSADDVPTSSPDAVFTIDTTRELGRVNRDVLGANFEYIGDDGPGIEPFVAGVPLLRFPGGDDQSVFQWNMDDPGTCTRPRWTWDHFANLATRSGSALVLETNLVRGSATSNAAWVQDAIGRGLQVAWVEIGDEPWGDWDAGFRTAEQYAADVRASAQAIRAVAPGTRVVLEIGTSGSDAWNRSALRATADVIDAVDYHYYPNKEASPDPMEIAANADAIVPLVDRLRAMIAQEAPDRAAQIAVMLGEYDGAADGSRYPPVEAGHSYAVWNMADALFYGAAPGELLEAGVSAALFYEAQGYRFGATGGNACLPTDYDVHRPKELAARMWREHFGDRRVGVTARTVPTFTSNAPTRWEGFAGEAPLVRAYASLTDDGRSLRLMVVNRSADRDFRVEFDLTGFVPSAMATVWRLAGDSITATNENVGGASDAVRIETLSIPAGVSPFVFTASAHSVNAVALTRGQ